MVIKLDVDTMMEMLKILYKMHKMDIIEALPKHNTNIIDHKIILVVQIIIIIIIAPQL